MSGNIFGQRFQFLTFGESHGSALGLVIEGCPAGVDFDLTLLQEDLRRRRPGKHLLGSNGAKTEEVVSARKEEDLPEVLSGVYQGKTLGTPIAILVRNQDARSSDYDKISKSPRTGHADDVWLRKFGVSDPRGGGRASGRETLSRVIAGSVAKMYLRQVAPELLIRGFAWRIGEMHLTSAEVESFLRSLQSADDYTARFVSEKHLQVYEYLKEIQAKGDSVSGVAQISVLNMIPNLGQPVFHKLKADLGQALLSLGAVSAVEFGDRALLSAAGGETGIAFHAKEGRQYGGIRGGISTGDELIISVGFKPTSSILDIAKQGRHDPCIVPRAIPVLEGMVACVLADHVLLALADKL